MNHLRKGIALVLLCAMCFGGICSAAAAEPAEAPSESPETSSSQSARLEATVSPAPGYYVSIPETVELGRLPADGDFTSPYTIGVTMSTGDPGTVIVSSDPLVELLPRDREDGTPLPCHNAFPRRSFTESGSAQGLLTIREADIDAALPGSYEGNLNFSMTYVPEKRPDPSKPSEPTEPGATEPAVPEPGAKRYIADVSMRKEGHLDELSMCNPLFYRHADVTEQDGMARLTFYFIDPVPAFPDEGTPVTHASLHFDGKEYPAVIDAAHKVTKHFEADPAFIPEAGDYSATPVTVELPMEAVRASEAGALRCTAFVEAVMHMDVTFHVVLSNLRSGETPEPPAPTEPAVPETTAPTEPAETLPSESGTVTYYTASVSMRKENDFGAVSMCNPLFHGKADLKVTGDTADLTLYVIDPVPQFADADTPLANVRMHYNGKTYAGSVNSGNKVVKSFTAQSGFIEKSGNYSASPVTIRLPMQAIRDSVDGKLTCTAFVSAVMKQDVDFHVVLTNLTRAGSPPSNQGTGSDLTVTLPESGVPADALLLHLGSETPQWKRGSVSMRRADDFDRESMCTPLFYREADIAFAGDLAELRLYVIDPIPKFADEGSPLSDVFFLYDDKSYLAVQHPEDALFLHFDMAPGFIAESGTYQVTPITVVLPAAAIEASADAKLICSAYINTVMHTTQKFFLVVGDLAASDGPVDSLEQPPEETATPSELPVPEATAPQPDGPIVLDTAMLPKVLGFGFLTALLLGAVFAVIWYRRNGKD